MFWHIKKRNMKVSRSGVEKNSHHGGDDSHHINWVIPTRRRSSTLFQDIKANSKNPIIKLKPKQRKHREGGERGSVSNGQYVHQTLKDHTAHSPVHSSMCALQFDSVCHSRFVRHRSGRTPASLLQSP